MELGVPKGERAPGFDRLLKSQPRAAKSMRGQSIVSVARCRISLVFLGG